MGGRGAASGALFSSVFERGAKERTIEVVFREARGWSKAYYKDTVLKAVSEKGGGVNFVYADPVKREKTSKTNRTQYLTDKEKAGAQNEEVFGINWKNVKFVSGQTFGIKDEIKKQGFKWNGSLKRWERG